MNIENLREAVRPYLKEKRYLHTLAVEKEAAALGEILLPDKIDSLRIAALLHDITKKEDLTKQLQYCAEFGIIVAEEEKHSPKIFHARTAYGVAKRDFAEWVNEEILNGVRYHTTGRADMTVFEAIVYLADYIEETRTFQDCITLRQCFYERIRGAKTSEEKLSVLTDIMILSFDMTIRNLLEENAPIDSDTIAARNFYVYKKITAENAQNGNKT